VFLILEVVFHGGHESMVSRVVVDFHTKIIKEQNVQRRRTPQISSGRKSEKRELAEQNKRNLFWAPHYADLSLHNYSCGVHTNLITS